MNYDEFDPRDLTKEKTLLDIYISSRRIPYSRFNIITTFSVFIMLILSVWINKAPLSESIKTIRDFSEIGLGVTLSTLGFLLSGFTIFATVSQPNLFVSMAKINHPDSGLSYLKHNFFIFMRVFIYYLTFASFCLLIIILGHNGGLVSKFVEFSPNPEKIKFIIVHGTYVIMFSSYYFLIMQLKSFVFNVYHAVMTSIRWNAEGLDTEN